MVLQVRCLKIFIMNLLWSFIYENIYPNEEQFNYDSLKTELQKIKRTDNLKIAIIIGPEGGIDKKEILQLKEVGAKTITLGQRILRTETASIVVISNIIYELEM